MPRTRPASGPPPCNSNGDLHIGNTSIGLLVTVSTAVGAIATLPIGALTDRINRTNLLAGAILIWSVAMMISGASTSFEMLLLTRLALGAVVATAGPTVSSLTGDLFPAAARGRIYGYILTGELIGTGIGFLVSGDVAAVLSWRYSFWVLAVPGVILAWAIWRLLPEPARGGQSRLQAGDEPIRSATQVAREQPVSRRTLRACVRTVVHVPATPAESSGGVRPWKAGPPRCSRSSRPGGFLGNRARRPPSSASRVRVPRR